MTRIGDFLRANNLRQADMVRFLGVSRPYMSQLVAGTARLSNARLEKILRNGNGWDVSMFSDPGEDSEEAPSEVAMLREKVTYLERLLEEKERLIGVLMGRDDTPGTGKTSPQCPFRTSKKSQTLENK